MKYKLTIFFLILLAFSGRFFLLPSSAHAQAWSGIIAPSRATDWSQAGVVGGVPSASWTQCGGTIAAYAGSAAAINSAIAACGTDQFVLLGSGTFTLTSGINFGNKSNVVLRGSGANSTFLVFSSGASVACDDGASLICIVSSDSTYWVSGTVYNWTAGYAQGATQITLSNTTGITTSTILVLNQCDDGYSGSTCSGASVDNGNYFNCSDQYDAASGTGCSFNGPDAGNGTAHRFEAELFQVTAVNTSTNVVTLASGLMHPNWNSARTPQAWFFTPIKNSGVEDLSIDSSATNAALYGIQFFNAANVWVSGVRIVDADIAPIAFFDSTHFTAEQNYLYEAQSVDDFGIHLTVTGNGLVQNNIIQQITVPIVMDGDDAGTVFAYNFTIDDCAGICSDALSNAFRPHSNGDDFQLYEGNVGTNYDADGDHGTHLSETIFRNFFTGWESCGTSNGDGGNGSCGSVSEKDFLTNAFLALTYQGRYQNVIGNVLGTPGYHTDYQYTNTLDNLAIYGIGTPVAGGVPPYDPKVLSTLMRWGNYDVVTGATRWCGDSSDPGWSTTCGSASEVPSGISVYPNSVPATTTLPASFYLSGRPSWWPNAIPFPAIGPDVSGGNVGQCSGTLNVTNKYNGVPATNASQCAGSSLNASAWAGHVNAIPAMNCYLNVMNGPPDGSGGVLPFNANNCYGGTVSGNVFITGFLKFFGRLLFL
jgi:hypothetical protein